MRELHIVMEPHAPDHLKRVVQEGLDFSTVAATGVDAYYPVSIFLKDARQEVLGGLLGHLWGGWLRIAVLWLAEPVRSQGYGLVVMRFSAQSKELQWRGLHRPPTTRDRLFRQRIRLSLDRSGDIHAPRTHRFYGWPYAASAPRREGRV